MVRAVAEAPSGRVLRSGLISLASSLVRSPRPMMAPESHIPAASRMGAAVAPVAKVAVNAAMVVNAAATRLKSSPMTANTFVMIRMVLLF